MGRAAPGGPLRWDIFPEVKGDMARDIWIVEEHEPDSEYPVCVLGAYGSFEAAEEAVEVHRAANLAEMAAGQRAEWDEDSLWWEIEPVNFEDDAPGERQAAAGAPSPEPQEQAAA